MCANISTMEKRNFKSLQKKSLQKKNQAENVFNDEYISTHLWGFHLSIYIFNDKYVLTVLKWLKGKKRESVLFPRSQLYLSDSCVDDDAVWKRMTRVESYHSQESHHM